MKMASSVVIITLLLPGCAAPEAITPRVQSSTPTVLVEFKIGDREPGPGLVELPQDDPTQKLYVHDEAILTNTHIQTTSVETTSSGQVRILIEMTKAGGEILATVTRNNLQKQMVILLDGEIIMSAQIISQISGGRVAISGRFSEEEATRRADAILGK